MTVLVEHDNSVSGHHGTSEDIVTTLEDLPRLVESYIQAGSCVYKLTVLPNKEGESWT